MHPLRPEIFSHLAVSVLHIYMHQVQADVSTVR